MVGNGAAELIKSLWISEWKVGFIRPTFEEYPNRYDRENSALHQEIPIPSPP